jgi:hypothetical protein
VDEWLQMTFFDLMLPALIAVVAVYFGVAGGRARAERMRAYRAETGRPGLRGHVIVGMAGLILGFKLLSDLF